MKYAWVIFAKTPGLSPVKTRLAASIGKKYAQDFYQRSLLTTYHVSKNIISRLQSKIQVDLIWAVAEKNGLEYFSQFEGKKIFQGKGDLGDRLSSIHLAIEREYSGFFFVGADSPHLDTKSISENLIEFLSCNKEHHILGEAYDGGFYLFGTKKIPESCIWKKVTYSNIETSTQLIQVLNQNSSIKFLKKEFDIDMLEDLVSMVKLDQKYMTCDQIKLVQDIATMLNVLDHPNIDTIQQSVHCRREY